MSRAKAACGKSLCGKPAEHRGLCAAHAAEADTARGNRHQRGYGTAHDRQRAQLLRVLRGRERLGLSTYCPRCERPIHSSQPLDADHWPVTLKDDPTAKANVLSHAPCNRAGRLPEAP